MHVKRLDRPTIREALRAAREELGPHAVVLSTEVMRAPGVRGWLGRRVVRVTAAAERPVSGTRAPVTENRHSRPAGPRHGTIARLVAAGLDRALAESVVSRMTDAECRAASEPVLRRALGAELSGLARGEDAYARDEVFVGPPGVGKTTTIGKLSAQFKKKGKNVILGAADTFSAAAVDQLKLL